MEQEQKVVNGAKEKKTKGQYFVEVAFTQIRETTTL